MGEGSHKAAKGLIRIKVGIRDNFIEHITISGDFFMYPEDRLWELEQYLIGTRAYSEEISVRIRNFYEKTGILTPGVDPEDFSEAIIKGAQNINS